MNRRFRLAVLSLSLTAFAAPALVTPVLADEPTAGFLPWYSNDAGLAAYAYERLSGCVTEQGVLVLSSRDHAREAVAKTGVDLE